MHIDMTPLLVTTVTAVGGLLIYLLSSKGEAKEAGRIMYFVGLFWLVSLLAHARW